MHLSYLVRNWKIPSQLEIRLLIGSETCLLFYSQDKTSWNAVLSLKPHLGGHQLHSNEDVEMAVCAYL